MKSHTSEFKEEIKMLGKQQSVRITYTLNNEKIILTDEDINSATPNYEASLLKSVMKVLELDSNVSIPKGTEIKFEYGLLVNGVYEYLNYGNYIVAKEPKKQEDTLSYKITCYDKMLYSMKDYEHIEVDYPCKIKKFLTELCKKIGLEFKDSTFANQDREFANELFMTINEDGTYSSMGYTYRDVLDQIAETTGGCICITLDDKVEVRYTNKLLEYSTSKNTNEVEIETQVKEKAKTVNIDGNSYQETTSGYQLFNWNGVSNLAIATYKNGVAKLTWTGGFDVFFLNNSEQYLNDLDTKKEYTISFKHKGNAIRMSNYATSQYNVITNNDNDYAKYSFTVTGVSFIRLDVIRKDTSGTAYIKELMVYEGTDDKLYEKYTGGAPSPSPDYPQDIEVIDGCNIFDGNFTTNGIWKDDGTINYVIQSKLYWRTDFIKIPNKNIYFSSKQLNIFSSAKLLEFDADKKYITSNKIYQVNSNLNKISLNENTKFIAIQWDLQNAAEIESLFTEFQITEGTSSKPYLPYGYIGLEQSGKNKFDNFKEYSYSNSNLNTTSLSNGIKIEKKSGFGVWVFDNLENLDGKIVRAKSKFNDDGNIAIGLASLNGTSRTIMKENTKSDTVSSFVIPKITDDKKYLAVWLYGSDNSEISYEDLIVTIDNEDMTYEPYHEPKVIEINLNKNTLAKVGDTKDKLIIHKNGEVEIEKNTWKDTINTSSLITLNNGNKGLVFVTSKNKTESMSDSDYLITNAQRNRTFNDGTAYQNPANFVLVGNSSDTLESIQAKFNGGEILYQLETPQIIKLPSIEPIELWQGTNIFKLITNLDTEIELEYPTNYDTINEEYINDTNVNFGEKYRPNKFNCTCKSWRK